MLSWRWDCEQTPQVATTLWDCFACRIGSFLQNNPGDKKQPVLHGCFAWWPHIVVHGVSRMKHTGAHEMALPPMATAGLELVRGRGHRMSGRRTTAYVA